MRTTARWVTFMVAGTIAMWSTGASADDITNKLPPGPIRQRHVLMKEIGEQAKYLNDAFDVGSEGFDTSMIQRGATIIATDAHQIPSLFPKGSTDPNSRALPKIWEKWDEFVKLAKQLQHQAESLSNAAGAEDDEDLHGKVKKMFNTCKSCHDQFRKPKDKDKKKN